MREGERERVSSDASTHQQDARNIHCCSLHHIKRYKTAFSAPPSSPSPLLDLILSSVLLDPLLLLHLILVIGTTPTDQLNS